MSGAYTLVSLVSGSNSSHMFQMGKLARRAGGAPAASGDTRCATQPANELSLVRYVCFHTTLYVHRNLHLYAFCLIRSMNFVSGDFKHFWSEESS